MIAKSDFTKTVLERTIAVAGPFRCPVHVRFQKKSRGRTIFRRSILSFWSYLQVCSADEGQVVCYCISVVVCGIFVSSALTIAKPFFATRNQETYIWLLWTTPTNFIAGRSVVRSSRYCVILFPTGLVGSQTHNFDAPLRRSTCCQRRVNRSLAGYNWCSLKRFRSVLRLSHCVRLLTPWDWWAMFVPQERIVLPMPTFPKNDVLSNTLLAKGD